MNRLSSLVVAAVLLASTPALAQRRGEAPPPPASPPPAGPSAAVRGGTIGLSAGISSGGATSLAGLYFLSPTGAIVANFGTTLQISGPDSSFSLNFGAGYRLYMGTSGPVSIFLQPGVSMSFTVGPVGSFSFGLGATGGLEYFLTEQLSLGLAGGLGVQIGTPGVFSLTGLGASSHLTFYF